MMLLLFYHICHSVLLSILFSYIVIVIRFTTKWKHHANEVDYDRNSSLCDTLKSAMLDSSLLSNTFICAVLLPRYCKLQIYLCQHNNLL
jgi:hypothetical protein